MNRFPHTPLLAAAALFLSGCAGYELGDANPSAYAGINNLHVPTFKNETLEPRLSSLVTNAVVRELQADGTYRISNHANADAVLVGQITQIQKTQLRAARTDTLESQELRMLLYVRFHLEDPVTGEAIRSALPEQAEQDSFNDRGIEEKPIYASQGQVVGTTIQFVDPNFQVGERNALSIAAQDAATKMVGILANGW